MHGVSLLEEIWSAFLNVPEHELLEDIQHNEGLQWIFEEARGERGASRPFDPQRDWPAFLRFIKDDYLPDRWRSFEEDFFREAVIEDGKLVVFRCIEHPKPEQLLRQIEAGRGRGYRSHLGLFWAFIRSAARCHWGSGTNSELHLTGLVDLSAIDIKGTVLANFHPEVGQDESEIRLLKGAPVTLVQGCFRPSRLVDIGGMPCRDIEYVMREA